MVYFADTIAAPATPTGTSALGIVRASGPLARRLFEEQVLESPRPRQACRVDYRDRAGNLIDDVICTFFQTPNSYTGENLVEISCHGNPFILSKILNDMLARGCRLAEPGEFTKRAFLNARLDLSQAEAVADLIHARSDRALAAANSQLRGALGRRIQQMVDSVVELLAQVEAYIDFPEEDLPPQDRSRLVLGVNSLLADTTRLQATNHYGEILREGLKTVIMGETNAGKSSLLNRLLGWERALVSSEPGTTRDYLEEHITLGPHCIRLTDTAGINIAPAALEKRGMAKALELAAGADLIILVLDVTRPPPDLEAGLMNLLATKKTLTVINKMDLSPQGSNLTAPEISETLRISALTGAGCDELVAAIVRHAESFRIEQGEDLVTINVRHSCALRQAINSLESAASKLVSGAAAAELLASDLRVALDSFGEINGRVDNERVLDHVFSAFCIGK